MAFDFETLKSYMSGIGLGDFKVKDEGSPRQRILAGFKTEDDEKIQFDAGAVFSLQEDGKFLRARIIQIWASEKVKASEQHWPVLMKYLLQQNYENKLGRWCMDPSDGDIYVDCALPIQDNQNVTQAQVERLMKSMLACINEAYSPVNRILDYGSPEKINIKELIGEIITKLPIDEKLIDRLTRIKAIEDAQILLRIKSALADSDFSEVDKIINPVR